MEKKREKELTFGWETHWNVYFFAFLNRHGLLSYRRFDLPAMIFKLVEWIKRITITEIHVKARTHVPDIHWTRTRKISKTAVISRECGPEELDVHLGRDIFGSLCFRRVSHAVVSSYIPEIIRRESTSGPRPASTKPWRCISAGCTHYNYKRKVHPTCVGNQARRVKEKRAFSFVIEGTKKTIARVLIRGKSRFIYPAQLILRCAKSNFSFAIEIKNSHCKCASILKLHCIRGFSYIGREIFYVFSVMLSRLIFEKNNISLVFKIETELVRVDLWKQMLFFRLFYKVLEFYRITFFLNKIL